MIIQKTKLETDDTSFNVLLAYLVFVGVYTRVSHFTYDTGTGI